MVKFFYIGQPTAGSNTKDIKLPCDDGTFVILENVEPGVTIITVSNTSCIDYMEKNPNFIKQD